MNGAAPKVKGSKGEREVVALYRQKGIEARRQPMSGAIPGHDFSGDVAFGPKLAYRAEVKRRRGLKILYRWLGGNNALWLREDGHDGTAPENWLVVLRGDEYLALAIGELKPEGAE